MQITQLPVAAENPSTRCKVYFAYNVCRRVLSTRGVREQCKRRRGFIRFRLNAHSGMTMFDFGVSQRRGVRVPLEIREENKW